MVHVSPNGYRFSMTFRKVEIEVDKALVDEVIRRFHMHSTREAVNLALRTLVADADASQSSLDDDEVDEFSNLDALRLHRSSESV